MRKYLFVANSADIELSLDDFEEFDYDITSSGIDELKEMAKAIITEEEGE